MTKERLRVCVEIGAKRVFASALAWPGWSRCGRDELAALQTLLDYADRYRPVAEQAGLELPAFGPKQLEILERLEGSATTDFGAPAAIASAERAPLSAAAARRCSALVDAAWHALAAKAECAPATLRKGPRGGGRDRDAVIAHVLEAEQAYARKLGIRPPRPDPADPDSVLGLRRALLEALVEPRRSSDDPADWPPAYGARRIAWHALDHAWEIEDRSS